MANGLNANLVRKWRSGRGTKRGGMAITAASSAATSTVSSTVPEFVAVEMPAPPKAVARVAAESMATSPNAEPSIHVELRRGPLHLNVRWPTAAAEDCRSWLRELTSGLLK